MFRAYTVFYKIGFAGGVVWEAHETAGVESETEALELVKFRLERKFGGHNGFNIIEMRVK